MAQKIWRGGANIFLVGTLSPLHKISDVSINACGKHKSRNEGMCDCQVFHFFEIPVSRHEYSPATTEAPRKCQGMTVSAPTL